MGAPGVLDGGVLDAGAEPGEQFVEVAAVLLLLALGQHDQAAAVADVGLDRVELLDGEDRAAQSGGALPAVGRGCAITKTSLEFSRAGVIGPSVCAATV